MSDCPSIRPADRPDPTDAFAAAIPALSGRRLMSVMPMLAELVREGDRVLDVGCGPGTMTLDVARLPVGPSSVTGVDHSARMVEVARREALHADVRHAHFTIGDANRLDFADRTFDLTYSNALLDWLPDPVAALREQARVTRRGGIVFFRLADLSSQTFYPACPDVTRMIDALHELASRHPSDAIWNPFLGARAGQLAADAGFEPIEIRPWSSCYRSAAPHIHSHLVLGTLLSGAEPPYSASVRRLVELGLIDSGSLSRARDQLRAVAAHPSGMSARSGVCVAARVP